ncbi:MAG TPA: endolytic transglycosylase MltG [Candidatus Paceibacterota bacterium]
MRRLIILTGGALIALIVFLILLNGFYLRLNRPVVKSVTIPEGLSNREITALLVESDILIDEELPEELEGYLFPDTYEFFVPSSLDFVVDKMSRRFNEKILSIIPEDKDVREIIIAASLIEEEVSSPEDRMIVSDIIWKRIKRGMFLEIDASICYIKPAPCHPIFKEDFKIDSKYNTYLYKGLPPGPITNPGLGSVEAAINPKQSPYWFYLSSSEGGETIFASYLDEHRANIVKYLK